MSNAIESQGSVFAIGNADGPPETFTPVGELMTMSGLDGQASEIDVTSLQSTAKEFLMGLQDWGSFKLEGNYLSADSGQDKMRAAKASRAKKHFKAIGIDYRQVDDKIINYWEAER